MHKRTRLKPMMTALLGVVVAMPVAAETFAVSDAFKAKVEPILQKSGGELHYFAGPGDMVGIGVNFLNGKQMVVYATADGGTLFSGVAIDVETGANLANADIRKLPAPDYGRVVERVSDLNRLTEGNVDSENRYYVFIDPTCGYCHKTYNQFLKLIAEGQDLVVHYLPIAILGPEAHNLAREMLAQENESGLEIFRQLARNEPYLTTREAVQAGEANFQANIAVFRELGFSGVPAVISDVGGKQQVRSGMLAADTIRQELNVAAAQKLASAQ